VRAGVAGFVVALLVGLFAVPSFAAGYRLNGLGSGCTEPGGSNTARGNMYVPGSTVSIRLGGQQIGSTVADSDGNVDASFVVPSNATTGTTSLGLAGVGTDGARSLSFELQVGGCSGSGSTSGTGASAGSASGSGALAFTGGSTGMTVGIAMAILLVGAALVAGAHKRRAQADQHV
jgi:hypothetical protein